MLQAMPQLTDRNHFEFGYDYRPFSFRQNKDEEWFVRYGKCKREPFDFKSECLRTAQTIRQNTKAPIHIMFSGGVDSEVVLRSFVESKIEVSAAILRFKNDLNIHDISWAVIACEALQVPYRFYDLDILNFWENQAFKYATPTYCVTPQLISTMWLVDQIDGYPVMGSAECLFVKDVPQDYQPGISPYERSEWSLWEKERIAAWYRHFIVRNREGCPGFYQYTPEIMLSYLKDPIVQDLVNDRIVGKLSSESSKLRIYQQHFELVTRPKYTGFEKIQKEDAFYREQLKNAFPYSDKVYRTKIRDLEKMLQPSIQNQSDRASLIASL